MKYGGVERRSPTRHVSELGQHQPISRVGRPALQFQRKHCRLQPKSDEVERFPLTSLVKRHLQHANAALRFAS